MKRKIVAVSLAKKNTSATSVWSPQAAGAGGAGLVGRAGDTEQR